jgi:meso-butanediol dehydrogenase / (S,S)-butanediol dehydrogenase / diacetyl reductase
VDTDRLAGRAALVTGGGTGIGAAVARRLAAEGALVTVSGRRRVPLDALVDSLPEGRGRAVEADVTDEAAVGRLVAAAVEHGGGHLDIVVNNAGAGAPGSVADIAPGAWRAALEVNLTAPLLVLQSSLPHLRAARGCVVNVSSVAGLRAVTESAPYCTAKAGLVMLTQQAALDLGPDVRVNAVCPGWVRTPMADGEMDELAARDGITREEAYALTSRDTPLGRPGEPEEVAAVVAFLASSEASLMTGSVVVADAGAGAVDLPTIAFD